MISFLKNMSRKLIFILTIHIFDTFGFISTIILQLYFLVLSDTSNYITGNNSY